MSNIFLIYSLCRNEGFALTGYVVPGSVEDGAWMLWGNSSVVAVVVGLARFFLDKVSDKSYFQYWFMTHLLFGTFSI